MLPRLCQALRAPDRSGAAAVTNESDGLGTPPPACRPPEDGSLSSSVCSLHKHKREGRVHPRAVPSFSQTTLSICRPDGQGPASAAPMPPTPGSTPARPSPPHAGCPVFTDDHGEDAGGLLARDLLVELRIVELQALEEGHIALVAGPLQDVQEYACNPERPGWAGATAQGRAGSGTPTATADVGLGPRATQRPQLSTEAPSPKRTGRDGTGGTDPLSACG